jgi:flavorubredoxin
VSANDVFEIVPGKLHRLGGIAPNDGWLTWVPPGVAGYAAFNCYLLTAPDRALLVGTGPAAFATETVNAVRRLTSGKTLSLVILRNEPEVLGGLSLLMAEMTPASYYYMGGGGIFDWIEDIRPVGSRTIALRDTVPMIVPAPDQTVAIAPGRQLEFLRAPFRVMGLWWVYDTETKSLFTEDTFCHVHLPTADTPVALMADDVITDVITVETVVQYLLMRADWLAGGLTAPIRDAVAKVFEERRVENICPARGRPIVGHALVKKHVALTLEAFDRCARLQPAGVL